MSKKIYNTLRDFALDYLTESQFEIYGIDPEWEEVWQVACEYKDAEYTEKILKNAKSLEEKIKHLESELAKERECVDFYEKCRGDECDDDGHLISFGDFDNGKRARQRIKEREKVCKYCEKEECICY